MKLKIFTIYSTLYQELIKAQVYIEADCSYFHYILTIPCLLFICSFGDMPGFATPFFEHLCLANFWTFSTRRKQDLNPSKVSK